MARLRLPATLSLLLFTTGVARADVTATATVDDHGGLVVAGKPAPPDIVTTVLSSTSPPPADHIHLVEVDGPQGPISVAASEVKTYPQGDEPLGLVVVVETHHLWLGNRSWWPDPANATDGLYAPLTAALDQLSAAGPPGSKAALVSFGDGAATRWSGDLDQLLGSAIGNQQDLTSTVTPDGKRKQVVGLDVSAGVEEAYADLQKMGSVARKVMLVIGDGAGSDALAGLKKQLSDAGIVAFAITVQDPGQVLPVDGNGYKKLTKDDRVLASGDGLRSAISAITASISDRYYVRFTGVELVKHGFAGDGKAHAYVLRGVDRNDVELPDLSPTGLVVTTPESPTRWWLWGAIAGGGALVLGLIVLIARPKKPPVPVLAPVLDAPALPPPGPKPKMATVFLDLSGEEMIPLVGWLVPLDGPAAYRTFKLEQRSNKIGTGSRCAIVIDDGFMSTEHSEVTCSTDGFEIADCNSANGTLVNGQRVQRHLLIDNDTITLGKTRLRFKSTR